MVETAIHQQCQLAIKQISKVGTGLLEAIHDEGDMATVEMTAMHDLAVFNINQRIVVGTVEFGFKKLPPPGQGVFHDTNHMWRATRGVAILQTGGVARDRKSV